jgi:lauroyl/myristoyl acyltransferase
MAMLADRPIAEHGISFDLPNGRTMLSSSPALLSWMTGCKILPVMVTRLSDGRYRISPPAIEGGACRTRNATKSRCLAAGLLREILRAPRQ